MEREFEKGKREIEMREIFSPETAAAGDAAYQAFAFRFLAFKIGVITIPVLLILGSVYLIIRKSRGKNKVSRKE
jgi:hypothetical protein